MPVCAACGHETAEEFKFCPECGAPVEAEAPQREQRKTVTVLFCDVVGYTEAGERLDPEALRRLQSRYFDDARAALERHGATVEKFIGDAVMAVFGIPQLHEDDALRAIRAAIELRDAVSDLGLAARIGVNTGEVVAGSGDALVTGDAVNVAARLEQAAEPGEILVGERTAAGVQEAFELGEPRAIAAKGKSEPVICRRLVRALPAQAARGVSAFRPAFVGRQRELAFLQAAYDRAAGQLVPELVTIVGDAGVGKTRLARGLWDLLEDESPEPRRFVGRCLAYGRGITYGAFADALVQHAGVPAAEPEAVLEGLEDGDVLRMTFGLDAPPDLHPLVARKRFEAAWIRLLESIAAKGPLVLLVEDLHWAEDPLLDLLERLRDEVSGPLLLLGTARPELLERRPGWDGDAGMACVHLAPLSRKDTHRMLVELLGGELPPSLHGVVTSAAEGNPFFVEELLAMLVDRGVLERTDRGWSAPELPTGFDVPDSVYSLLAARIDLLRPPEKETLQAAAVIGRNFWPGPLSQLLEGSRPDLPALEERDFIRRSSISSLAGEEEYSFKHTLTREVAYGGLSKAQRAFWHAAFADWLERREGGADEHAPLLAHHCAEAARPDYAVLAWPGDERRLEELRGKAVGWCRRAADLAMARYALAEAIALLHRALEFEPRESGQANLWQAIGKANALNYDGEAFWTSMQHALRLSSDERMDAQLYSELAFRTGARSGMWKRRPARDLVDGWIARALELAEPGSHEQVTTLIARALSRPAERHEDARTAAGLAEQLDDVEVRSFAYEACSTAALALGHYEEALEWGERMLELVPELTDPDVRGDPYWHTAFPCLALGRIDDARRFAHLHDAESSQLTVHHAVHGVGLLVVVEAYAGRWRSVCELQQRAESAAMQNADTPCVYNGRILLLCALANASLGDEAEARRLEEAADALEMEGHELMLDPPRIRLALLRGDLALATRLLARMPNPGLHDIDALTARLDALGAVGDRERVETEAPPLVRPNTYVEPFALRALGIVRSDPSMLERAAARFSQLGCEWHACQTRALVSKQASHTR